MSHGRGQSAESTSTDFDATVRSSPGEGPNAAPASRDPSRTQPGATLFSAFLDGLLALPRWLYRSYRRRLSVQLIVSHALVVLLTAGLLIALIVVALGYSAGPFGDSTPLIDQLSSTSASLAGQAAAQFPALERGPRDPGYRAYTGGLQAVVAGSHPRPGAPNQSGTIERVVVAAAGGTILTGVGQGVASGQPIQTLDASSGVLSAVMKRALQLRGRVTSFGSVRVYDSGPSSAVAAYPVTSLDGRFLGVVGVEEQLVRSPILSHHNLALAVAGTFLIGMILLSIPAILISIPFGVWRAKVVSRRVERLALAADAMAQGDLTHEVDIEGTDEIARLGDRFNMMRSSLSEADESRRAFVSNVSHDLRTPLAIIQGNVERLIDRTEAVSHDPAPLADLDSIRTEVETLDHLVGDLFTLARLDEAVLSVQPKPIAVGPIMREVVDGIKTIARTRQGVSIDVMPGVGWAEPLPKIMADELRVRQILANLVYNALRHTPEGGVILLNAQLNGSDVEISVTDTGVGIMPEELPRVFDRNFRATNHSGLGYREGGGLGLAIVKQLVEAQHGEIRVESQPGEGTTFHFTLPAALEKR